MAPESPEQPPQGFGVGFADIIGPDGRHWIGLSVISGPVNVTIGLPPDTAPQFLEHFNNCADAVRRANLGLIVAANQNGHGGRP